MRGLDLDLSTMDSEFGEQRGKNAKTSPSEVVVPGGGMNGETGAQCGCVSHIAHVIHAVLVGAGDARTAPEEAMEV